MPTPKEITQFIDESWHKTSGVITAEIIAISALCTLACRRASVCNVELDNFYQVEDFICWMLEQEPLKSELYYCLGFINWQIKEDRALALEYFRKFLELCDEGQYIQEKKLTEEWIIELQDKTKSV